MLENASDRPSLIARRPIALSLGHAAYGGHQFGPACVEVSEEFLKSRVHAPINLHRLAPVRALIASLVFNRPTRFEEAAP